MSNFKRLYKELRRTEFSEEETRSFYRAILDNLGNSLSLDNKEYLEYLIDQVPWFLHKINNYSDCSREAKRELARIHRIYFKSYPTFHYIYELPRGIFVYSIRDVIGIFQTPDKIVYW